MLLLNKLVVGVGLLAFAQGQETEQQGREQISNYILFQYVRPNQSAPNLPVFPDLRNQTGSFATSRWADASVFLNFNPHDEAEPVEVTPAAASSTPTSQAVTQVRDCAQKGGGLVSDFLTDAQALVVEPETGNHAYIEYGYQGNATSVLVSLVCPTTGCCGFGPSPDLRMAGTDAAIGCIQEQGGGALYEYELGNHFVNPSMAKTQGTATLLYASSININTC